MEGVLKMAENGTFTLDGNVAKYHDHFLSAIIFKRVLVPSSG